MSYSAFVAVVVGGKILLVLNRGRGMFLYTQGPKKGNFGVQDDYWGMPGGDEDEEDGGSKYATALRELHEEVRIKTAIDDTTLCDVDPVNDDHVVFTFLATAYEGTIAANTEEVLEAGWFPLDDLPDNISFRHRKRIERLREIFPEKF